MAQPCYLELWHLVDNKVPQLHITKVKALRLLYTLVLEPVTLAKYTEV